MVVLRQKVCFVGDGTVGKTALAQMAFSGGVTFPRNYLMTMGVDLSVKEVQVSPDITVELFMYDVSGQEVYKKTVGGFVDGLDWFVAVYDVTSKTTFENTTRWIDMCRQHNKEAHGVLVANKSDMKDKAEISDHAGESAAKGHNVEFLQASALRNAGVSELMKHICETTARNYEEFMAKEMKRGK